MFCWTTNAFHVFFSKLKYSPLGISNTTEIGKMPKDSISPKICFLQVSWKDLKSTWLYTQSLENLHVAGHLQAIHLTFQLPSPLDINVSSNETKHLFPDIHLYWSVVRTRLSLHRGRHKRREPGTRVCIAPHMRGRPVSGKYYRKDTLFLNN